jgi:hypothetical protein
MPFNYQNFINFFQAQPTPLKYFLSRPVTQLSSTPILRLRISFPTTHSSFTKITLKIPTFKIIIIILITNQVIITTQDTDTNIERFLFIFPFIFATIITVILYFILMILYSFCVFLILTLATVRADLPIHCLKSDIVGTWEFKITKQ